ncbi:hypothetical protein BC629DRAFT_519085 [Irpex lacteus]|nr:hypothetical protein BC629DRAFT_519085 [Irpex lacteus]
MLWTTLSLSGERHPEEKVELWLSRNRGLLRALYIRDANSGTLEALKALSDVSLDNLRALTVGEPGDEPGYPQMVVSFLTLTPSIISNLQSLTLMSVFVPWLHTVARLRIRHFDARSAMYGWDLLAALTGELRTLYHEDSHPPRLSDLLCLFRNNPYLESVTLKFFQWQGMAVQSPSTSSPSGSIQLTHLTYLSIRGDALPANLFIPSLSLPNLRHLELEGLCRAWDDTIPVFITSNIVGRLISLAIVYKYFSYSWERETRPDRFIELFRHTKQLRCLEMFQVTHIGPVVRALAHNPGTLCPNLRTLDVSRCPDVDDELLIGIVDARNGSNYPLGDLPISAPTAAGTTLHKLVFNSCEKVTASTVSWLRDRVPHVTCHYNRERRERNRRKPKRDATHW